MEIVIEILKIFTQFISDNPKTTVILTLLVLFRRAISGLISRLTNFSVKAGDQKLEMQAADPTAEKENIVSSVEKPIPQSEEPQIEEQNESWFDEARKALTENRLDDAETAFRKYASKEKDEVKLERSKALYFYIRFHIGKDDSSITNLEELIHTAKTQELKFYGIEWLSICLHDTMQTKKEIKIWQDAIIEMKSPLLIAKSVANLADALDRDGKNIEAKKLLIQHLSETLEDQSNSILFDALSKIENSLLNKTLSIYCKDKSLEFDPHNREELFNSAYTASNEGINDISISNYIRLLKIDSNNSTALNNLGVHAENAELESKAIENYKEASKYKNTLAMANQGYLLLKSGFLEEAEEIAKRALEQKDPHENVHSLITAIKNKRDEQEKDWSELIEKSIIRQNSIREYTAQYYLGNPTSVEGDWFVKNKKITISTHNHELMATWQEISGLSQTSYTVQLTGKISGSSFSGKYIRQNNEVKTNTLLGAAMALITQDCLGYLSDNGSTLKLIPKNHSENFTLCLYRDKEQEPTL